MNRCQTHQISLVLSIIKKRKANCGNLK